MTASFRSNVFDPLLVVCQIIAMQCFFYVSLGFWLVLANLLAGLTHSVDQFFDYHVSELLTYWLDTSYVLWQGLMYESETHMWS